MQARAIYNKLYYHGHTPSDEEIKTLAGSAKYSYLYARNIINGRFKEGERSIKGSPFEDAYVDEILNGEEVLEESSTKKSKSVITLEEAYERIYSNTTSSNNKTTLLKENAEADTLTITKDPSTIDTRMEAVRELVTVLEDQFNIDAVSLEDIEEHFDDIKEVCIDFLEETKISPFYKKETINKIESIDNYPDLFSYLSTIV